MCLNRRSIPLNEATTNGLGKSISVSKENVVHHILICFSVIPLIILEQVVAWVPFENPDPSGWQSTL